MQTDAAVSEERVAVRLGKLNRIRVHNRQFGRKHVKLLLVGKYEVVTESSPQT